MHTITIPTMISMISHIGVGLREPLMFWGPPGCGKSEGVQGAAEQHGAHLVDVRLSQYDSVDLRGIPVPSDDLTVWHAPATMPFKSNKLFDEYDDIPIFLFLDEINSAAPAVSAVAYQLINDRAVGEHELRDNVVVIAAGNREGDKGVVNRMPTPLANRFTHAEVTVDVDAWCEWAIKKGLPQEGVAFMQFRRTHLSQFDPAKPHKAFATPRSWVKALKYFASDMPQDIKQAGMSGAIGEGTAAEFWGFIDVYQKVPTIAQICAKPDTLKLPDEASLRYATAVSISSAMNTENAAPLCTYLYRMDPEFAVLAWKLVVVRDRSLTATKEFSDFAKTNKDLFN